MPGREEKKESEKRFDKFVESMPELIDEMKSDFTDDKEIRLVYLLPNSRVAFIPSDDCFIYYEDRHRGLKSFFMMLDEYLYVTNITEGNVPKYFVNDEFIEMLQKW